MPKPDINRLIDFQRLLLQFSQIERVIQRPGAGSFVHENDTEHSYNLALTAWFLAEHFPGLDRDLLIRFALIHDLVEIHAGDTYIFADADTIATKHDREAVALKQLRIDWVDFPELIQAIEKYERKDSSEAKFIYALDKIMPMMLNIIGDGHTWKIEGISLAQLHAVKVARVSLSPEIKPYYDQLCKLLQDSPHLIPPR